MLAKVYVGTSGFYYPHWIGAFYPEGLAKTHWLEYFVQHFKTVEMNSTFYHLPKAKTIEHWVQRSPDNFLFSFKAWRVITHYKKLKDIKDDLYLFLQLIKPIRQKTAAILFQLPPSLHKDTTLLESFLQLLPPGYRFAIEFRHDSWYDDEIIEMLRRYRVALCLHDFGQKKPLLVATGDFVYIRLHGPSGHYQGSYNDESLQEWAESIKGFTKNGKETYVYFNNDMHGYAVRDAKRLKVFLAS